MSNIEPKRVKISSQQQIKIPKIFCDLYSFDKDIFVIPTENGLLLQPVSMVDGAQSEAVLRKLVENGFSGDELIKQFRKKLAIEPIKLDPKGK